MNEPTRARLLAHAARRAAYHPAYMAWVFASYAEAEGIPERAVGRLLGVGAADMRRAGLCLRPRQEHWLEDLMQIAAKFNLDEAALISIVRMVDALKAMSGVPRSAEEVDDAGLLLAARARRREKMAPGRRRGRADD